MTAFRFSLQKVLDWRQTQLELEEAKLQQAMAALLQLDRLRADVEAEAIRAEAELRASPLVSGHDLAALGGFRLRVKGREHEIDQRRDQGRNHVAEQQVRMLEARRRARLLERLRERRSAEWQSAQSRELEQMASASYLAQWDRRSG